MVSLGPGIGEKLPAACILPTQVSRIFHASQVCPCPSPEAPQKWSVCPSLLTPPLRCFRQTSVHHLHRLRVFCLPETGISLQSLLENTTLQLRKWVHRADVMKPRFRHLKQLEQHHTAWKWYNRDLN